MAWDRGLEDWNMGNAHLFGKVFSVDGDVADLDGWPIGEPVDGLVPRCDGADCSWDDPFTGGVESPRDDSGGWHLSVAGRGGAYLVQAISQQETYCPALAWTPDPDALAGSSVQLVRGDRTYTLDAYTWWLSAALPFTDDGQCALVTEGDSQFVLDLATGERTPVEGAGGWLLDR